MKTTMYCLFICYLSIWASCNKKFDCRGTIHNFEAFYRAYPDRDSVQVGDTIWFELNTLTQLKDLNTGQMVDFSGAGNFGTAVGYIELKGGDISNPGSVAAANDFDNHILKGRAIPPINPNQTRAFIFAEENGEYKFKIGVIPKKVGVFAIGVGNAANVYQEKDRCKKSNFSLTFKDTNQRIYLLEQSRPGYTASEYERDHAYCFKVY